MEFDNIPPDFWTSLPPEDDPQTVTRQKVDARSVRQEAKQRLRHDLGIRRAADVAKELPPPGVVDHYVLNGTFDQYHIFQRFIELAGGAEEALLATWSIGRQTVTEIAADVAAGRIKRLLMITDAEHAKIHSEYYGLLMEALRGKEAKLILCNCHAKLAAFKDARGECYIMEGSANLTGNPRLENLNICRSTEVYNMYRALFADIDNNTKKYARNSKLFRPEPGELST